MGQCKAEAWVCDVCGHVWLCGDVFPVRCAKCKSMRWNSGVLHGRREAVRESVPMGHSAKSAPQSEKQAPREVVERLLEGRTGRSTSESAAGKVPGCLECGSVAGHQKWCSKK